MLFYGNPKPNPYNVLDCWFAVAMLCGHDNTVFVADWDKSRV